MSYIQEVLAPFKYSLDTLCRKPLQIIKIIGGMLGLSIIGWLLLIALAVLTNAYNICGNLLLLLSGKLVITQSDII